MPDLIDREEVIRSPELAALGRRKLSEGNKQDEACVVWWPLGTMQNPRKDVALPHIEVLFRGLRPDNTFGEFFSRTMAITSLPLLSIGSIWSNKRSTSQIRYQRRLFTVDFSDGKYDFVSMAESGGSFPFPPEKYLLRNHDKDRSKMVRLTTANGRTLLIPAAVFLARCYGRSGRLTRLLTQHPLKNCLPMMCSAILGSSSSRWQLRLHPGMYQDDALLLGHLLFEEQTRQRVNELFPQLQAVVRPRNPATATTGSADRRWSEHESEDWFREVAFPKIHPWWHGTAQLEVEGLQVDERTFLGLRITGMSQPSGPPIEVVRDQALTEEDDGVDERRENGEMGPGGYYRRQFDADDKAEASLVDLEAPTTSSGSVLMRDPKMQILGVAREIVSRSQEGGERKPRGTLIPQEEPADQASAAERGGSQAGGVSYASHHSAIELKSYGTLRDLWEGLRFLATEHPQQVMTLSWFTREDDFVQVNPRWDSRPPRLQPLRIPGLSDHEGSPAGDSWGYVDVDRRAPRGVLVARVTTPDRTIFILDVERRSKVTPDGGLEELKNDEYSGLVLVLKRPTAVDGWLPRVLEAIRKHRGVMSRVLPYCPGDPKDDFRHSKAKDDRVSGQAAARNALSKGGVELGKLTSKQRVKRSKSSG
ncbi:hypothetical protein [Mitsuaria sp. GD03876]|uniref:hypothetical protein n=1 Tax=Mitsuaria sp. GD03876 TaxID=2975399 RepID=UPI00244B37BB|nr:hypothetical protein [Mitsuaria sp. GD03876]MDH0863705.1 hypothetical protein [Mitsuaria sp. GD03876]